MNCARVRFLLYAYLDRDLPRCEAELLSRHLAACPPCATRAESARNVVKVLRSRLDRATVPSSLRQRLHRFAPPASGRPGPLTFAAAATIMLLMLPVVADVPPPPASSSSPPLGSAGRPAGPLSASVKPVAKRMTGTLVCLHCESRAEVGLRPLTAGHEAGFCESTGEAWRLMSRDASCLQASLGQTATVEGIAFPESGFLLASRVGY